MKCLQPDIVFHNELCIIHTLSGGNKYFQRKVCVFCCLFFFIFIVVVFLLNKTPNPFIQNGSLSTYSPLVTSGHMFKLWLGLDMKLRDSKRALLTFRTNMLKKEEEKQTNRGMKRRNRWRKRVKPS